MFWVLRSTLSENLSPKIILGYIRYHWPLRDFYNHWVFSLSENLDHKLEKKSWSSQPGWCAWSLARTDGRPVVADWPTGCLHGALLDHGSSRWHKLARGRTFWSRPDQGHHLQTLVWFGIILMRLKHVTQNCIKLSVPGLLSQASLAKIPQ